MISIVGMVFGLIVAGAIYASTCAYVLNLRPFSVVCVSYAVLTSRCPFGLQTRRLFQSSMALARP